MVGWYHQLNGHEFEQTLGHSEKRKPSMLPLIGLQTIGVAKSGTQLSNGTELNDTFPVIFSLN